jgi:formiminotetrahydrofolate cyclodeaminase
MREFATWLDDLSTKPVPGGIAAAAVAAAMGAALVAKAARVTLDRRRGTQGEKAQVQAVLDLAQGQQAILLDLAPADEQAYQAVLDLGALAWTSPAGRHAWQLATEVPIRVAEACRALLAEIPHLAESCWPVVYPDLKTGEWLLSAALQAGLLSAESNMRFLGDGSDARALRARMDDLTTWSERDD